MKLKRILLILLATVACLCLGLVLGCKEEENQPDNNTKCKVTFAVAEHVKYVIDGNTVEEYLLEVDKDAYVNFSVAVEEGWLSDTVVVKANDETLAAVGGVYSYRASSDATITATVSEDLLEGAGTEESPFLVSSVKDLRFIADMVNSGNPNYVVGYYELLNDIDCGGATLDVIGHFENQYAFFAGMFDGKNHTISNYVIETSGKYYAGLFGCVQISTANSASIIQNLNLKDFKVNATAASDHNVVAGGIAAVSAGANVVACNVENGQINVHNNHSAYFSYAGGAVGLQQSLTVTGSDGLMYHYHGSVEYVHTKVSVSANGYVFSAGGIVGVSTTSHERSATMIINCYSESSLFGAMRSGGIVGTLDDNASVANCYSMGIVSSTSQFNSEADEELYYALAGGIAGYAGNESTISDSFTTCNLSANGINTGHATGDIYACASPATEFVHGVTAYNCYSGDAVNATCSDFIKNTLHWNDADWVIVDGKYPTTNYDQGENSFEITLIFEGHKVDGKTTKVIPVDMNDDSYFTFSSYLGGLIQETYTADEKGYTSYGFFFKENGVLKKVPFGYVPTRDVDIYVCFADYSAVAGTYEFVEDSGRTVKLILNTDGTYQYVDVRSFDGSSYVYDGTKVIFNDALFARLSSMMVGDTTPQPWLNYQPYKFVGTLSDGKLSVYDGIYFTDEADNRLVFEKVGAEQTDKNVFLGTWERSATIKETYNFTDSAWTYIWKGQTLSGGYTVNGGVATLSGDITATATIDASGLLLVKEDGKDGKYYKLANSLNGNWYCEEEEIYLVLNGYGNDLAGNASAIVNGIVYDNLAYVDDGFFETWTPDNVYTYTLVSGYSLFGYFYYDANTGKITASFYDESVGGFQEYRFVLYDYYLGEWVGEDEVGGDKPFTIMDFNGLGLYKVEGGTASLGYIVINGEEVEYECSVDNWLNGKFTYNGTEYTLTADGEGTVTVKFGDNGENSASFIRKDEMANTPLMNKDNIYEFDGYGNLPGGGKMTVTSTKGNKEKVAEYSYKIEEGTIANRDIVIGLYNGPVSGTKVGSVTIQGNKFVLSLNGQKDASLDLYFSFGGRYWAISGISNRFYIGNFDLTPDERFAGMTHYSAKGTFNGDENVPFVYFPEYNYIYISYVSYSDASAMGGTQIQIYLLILSEGNIALSSYPYLVNGDYSYAAPEDGLFGDWENTETRAVISFNGLADSMYAYGLAIDKYTGAEYFYTRGFGTVYMWRVDDLSVAYSVELIYDDITGEDIYKKTTGSLLSRMKLKEVDILNTPILTATDGDGTSYEFYLDGTVKVGDKTGSFSTTTVDGNSTTGVITVDGKELTVVVNHSGTVEVLKVNEKNN